MATDQDMLRFHKYEYLVQKAEDALNAETIARDAYITIQGFNGTQTLGPVSNGFRVYSYMWGAVNSGIIGGVPSGGGASFSDMYVIMDVDPSLPSFLTGMAKPNPSSPIQQAQLFFLQQDSSAIGNITLQNLFISDVQVLKIKSKQNRPVVLIALSYQQININIGTAKGGYSIPKGDKV